MRAVVVTRFGGPEVLEVRDEPVPEPGPGQLLVDVDAAGINFRDVYEREGGYGGSPPFIAGVEGAGPVAAAGEGVREFAVGDRVAWSSAQGSHAERVVVEASEAVPVPAAMSSETAAASLLQGMTAHYLATSTYPVRPGDTVLVHAAAGGVGLLLTQVVKIRGGRVIGTTSSDDKAQLAREAGADEVIGYDGFAERARELTAGAGVAAVYDGVGKATFQQSLAALRARGTMVLFGAASGPAPSLEPARLAAASLFLTRPMLRDHTATREELLARATEVFGWIGEGRLQVRIGGRYRLEDVGTAHGDLQGRRTTGKLILLPAA
jgi:NADPH2:quinone reductase